MLTVFKQLASGPRGAAAASVTGILVLSASAGVGLFATPAQSKRDPCARERAAVAECKAAGNCRNAKEELKCCEKNGGPCQFRNAQGKLRATWLDGTTTDAYGRSTNHPEAKHTWRDWLSDPFGTDGQRAGNNTGPEDQYTSRRP